MGRRAGRRHIHTRASCALAVVQRDKDVARRNNEQQEGELRALRDQLEMQVCMRACVRARA